MAREGLSPEHRRVLEAVAERILPSIELTRGEITAGAREAGVAPYVERAIAGRFALAPWRPLFEEGLDRLEAWSRESSGSGYADLPPEPQDALLRRLQERSDARGRACVDRLVVLCLEGFLCHPAHPSGRGGNRGGAGWRAVGLPADGSWPGGPPE